MSLSLEHQLLITEAVDIIRNGPRDPVNISGLLPSKLLEEITPNQRLWIINRLDQELDNEAMMKCVNRMTDAYTTSAIQGIRQIINEE